MFLHILNILKWVLKNHYRYFVNFLYIILRFYLKNWCNRICYCLNCFKKLNTKLYFPGWKILIIFGLHNHNKPYINN